MDSNCVYSNISTLKKTPLFKNIKEYDYKNVIDNIIKNLKGINIQFIDDLKLLKNKIQEKFILNPLNIESYVLSHYIQSRTESKLIVSYDIDNEDLFVKNFTRTDNKIIFIKFIKLNFIESIAFFNQINYFINVYQKYDDILNFIKKIFINKSFINIGIVCFENCNSDLGTIINTICNYNKCIIFRNFNKVIDFSKFVLNENSIKYLKYTYSKNIYDDNFAKCYKFINNYKDYLNKNFTNIERIKFIIFSSAILFTLGLRSCTDLDIFVSDLPTNTKTFITKVDKFTLNSNFDFLDLSLKGIGNWTNNGAKKHWDDFFIKEWPQSFNAENIYDVMYNPKFHFYFFGLKLVSLEGDIERRKIRQRPAGFADLIAIKKYLKINISMPKIPYEFYKSIGVIERIDTDNKVEHFYNTILSYIKRRYNFKISRKDVMQLIKPDKKSMYKSKTPFLFIVK